MLPKSLTSTLPVLGRPRTCEACGQPFTCEIDLARGCWCGEMELSAETRAELRKQFRDCLCRSCLEKAKTHTLLANGEREQH